jgi:hypothetical protein
VSLNDPRLCGIARTPLEHPSELRLRIEPIGHRVAGRCVSFWEAIMGTKVYFFSGARCVAYDRSADKAFAGDDESPSASIAAWSPSLAASGFGADIDAAVNWGNGKIYFFRQDKYVRFDIKSKSVDTGYPLLIRDQWTGMSAAGFDRDLDCAVNWGNGKVYFFKGDKYVRYDVKLDKVDDGYPMSIAAGWPGFGTAGFGSGINSFVPWGNGKAYAFQGNRYVRYDILDDRVDDGYPLIIGDNWPGMSTEGFGSTVKAGVDLMGGLDVWLPGAKVIASPVNGPTFLDLPWRGILHTTEGGTIDSNVQTYRDHGNIFPHFTIDPRAMAVAQHIGLNVGSRAVGDNAVPANASRAIQIEICGRAAESNTWPPEHIAFIKSVMQQIEELVPIPHQSGLTFLAYPISAADDARNRMNAETWRRFSGWCGHQHVPGNTDRGDPGAIDIDFLVS